MDPQATRCKGARAPPLRRSIGQQGHGSVSCVVSCHRGGPQHQAQPTNSCTGWKREESGER
uniref:Uncharacterized protein n=1 Tax=Arundo donax TaxID=35708 RepID=A0A0A9AI53_ARUDO